MRGVLVAEEDNFKSYYIDNIFNAIWQDGLNINDENILQKILKNLNVNPKTFLLRVSSSSIKDFKKKKLARLMKKVFLELQVLFLIIKYFGDKIELSLRLTKQKNNYFFLF